MWPFTSDKTQKPPTPNEPSACQQVSQQAVSSAMSQQLATLQQHYAQPRYRSGLGLSGPKPQGPTDKHVMRATRDTEILAWRAWRLGAGVTYQRPCLWSITRDVPWKGPVMSADKEPALDHTHGIYALREPDTEYRRSQHSLHGVVALSGTVIEGTTGYRAERAVIRGLWFNMETLAVSYPDRRPIEVMAELEDRYQCPVSFAQGHDATAEIRKMLREKVAA